jgi:hypothetical protein
VHRAASFLTVALLALVLAGCGDDDTPLTSSDSTVASTSSTTDTTVAAEEPIGEMGVGDRETSGFPTANREGGAALLTDVRVASHDGFDRVTFEFRDGDVPGYRVQFVDPPITADPSDNPVEIDGTAFLSVVMTPASGVDLSGETYEEIYTGPDRIGPADTTAIVELVLSGDFEAVLTWVVGLDAEAPFAVGTLLDPPRLVIDVRAG